jgi:hypothetical protein
MSASETTTKNPSRETVGGVLGLALGCLLVVWGFRMPFGEPAATPIPDGEALLRAHFDVRDLPFDAVIVSAERLRDGRELVLLRPASAAHDAAAEVGPEPQPVQHETEPTEPHDQGEGGKWYDKTDWAGILESEAAEPLEVLVAHYSESGADAAIRRNFRNLSYKDFESVDEGGETVPIDAGELAWAAYDVRYVHLRVFTKDDDRATFYDLLRVNLTLDRTCWIVHLRWADRVPGQVDDARTVLEAIRPSLQASTATPAAN